MGTEAHDVLEEDLVVGGAQLRAVARVLQPQAGKLARAPVDHEGVARRVVGVEDREVRRAQSAGIHQRDARRAGIEAVIAVTRAPLRPELVDALGIEARLALADGRAQDALAYLDYLYRHVIALEARIPLPAPPAEDKP